jgi:thymidylate synthase/dihydrofolate reductase
MLARFNIIVAVDSNGGIAKNGTIPWSCKSDMQYFRTTTMGQKIEKQQRNVVIMGMNTYNDIPVQNRPLKDRTNIVLSRKMSQSHAVDYTVYRAFHEALQNLGAQQFRNGGKPEFEVWVCGGKTLYDLVLDSYLYLCDTIHVTEFKLRYDCDTFIDWDKIKRSGFKQNSVITNNEYTRFIFSPNIVHEEYKYLKMVSSILENGENRPDRTGIGTIELFDERTCMSFDITERVPLLTTKKMHPQNAIKELMFFINGFTDTKILENKGVNWWKSNTSRSFLAKRDLTYEEGDMGPAYGHNFRHFGTPYFGSDADYTGKGFDQLQAVIDSIRADSFSRRHVMTSWDPSSVDKCALPPCHGNLIHFQVSANRIYLNMKMVQRSGDMFLGVPYNIFSYAILLIMVSHLTGYRPGRLIIDINCAHIYLNHVEACKKQIVRTPYPWAKVKIRNPEDITSIDHFDETSFIIEDYFNHPEIRADMAV